MSTDPKKIVTGYVVEALQNIPQVKQLLELKPKVEQAVGFVTGMPALLEQTKQNWVEETKAVIASLRAELEEVRQSALNGSGSGNRSSSTNNTPSDPTNPNNTSTETNNSTANYEGGFRRGRRARVSTRRRGARVRVSRRK